MSTRDHFSFRKGKVIFLHSVVRRNRRDAICGVHDFLVFIIYYYWPEGLQGTRCPGRRSWCSTATVRSSSTQWEWWPQPSGGLWGATATLGSSLAANTSSSECPSHLSLIPSNSKPRPALLWSSSGTEWTQETWWRCSLLTVSRAGTSSGTISPITSPPSSPPPCFHSGPSLPRLLATFSRSDCRTWRGMGGGGHAGDKVVQLSSITQIWPDRSRGVHSLLPVFSELCAHGRPQFPRWVCSTFHDGPDINSYWDNSLQSLRSGQTCRAGRDWARDSWAGPQLSSNHQQVGGPAPVLQTPDHAGRHFSPAGLESTPGGVGPRNTDLSFSLSPPRRRVICLR